VNRDRNNFFQLFCNQPSHSAYSATFKTTVRIIALRYFHCYSTSWAFRISSVVTLCPRDMTVNAGPGK